MPELPEVETSRRGIEPHLVGATILHAVVRNGRLRWPVSEEIYRLSDVPVLSVRRRAKYLRAEGRVLQGRCLGPTRSLQG